MTPPQAAPSRPRLANGLYSLGAVACFLVILFLTPPEGGVAGRELGFLIGYFLGVAAGVAVVTLLVYGIVRFIRRHRAPPRAPVVAFWTLLSLAALSLVPRTAGRRSPGSVALSPDDRRALLLDADSIRHPGLGFAVPNPGSGFATAPAIQARLDSSLAGHPDMAGWALTSSDQREIILVQLTKFAFLDEARFRSFAAEFRGSVTHSGQTPTLEDSLEWHPPDGDFRMAIQPGTGGFLKTRCISRSRPDGHYVLCVETVTADDMALDSVRAGLTMRR